MGFEDCRRPGPGPLEPRTRTVWLGPASASAATTGGPSCLRGRPAGRRGPGGIPGGVRARGAAGPLAVPGRHMRRSPIALAECLSRASMCLARRRSATSTSWRSDETGPFVARRHGSAAAQPPGRLPDRPRDRPGRHGGRLRGRAGLAGPAGGAQGPAVRRGDGPPAGAAVPGRGPGRRPPAPPAHRADLRRGLRAGVHYYAMQLIDGQSLAAVIAELATCKAGVWARIPTQPGPGRHRARGLDLPSTTRPAGADSPRPGRFFRDVARLGIQAAEALEHAHPWASSTATSSRPTCCSTTTAQLWVADFGLARLQGDRA